MYWLLLTTFIVYFFQVFYIPEVSLVSINKDPYLSESEYLGLTDF